jgi:hypothetical protein
MQLMFRESVAELEQMAAQMRVSWSGMYVAMQLDGAISSEEALDSHFASLATSSCASTSRSIGVLCSAQVLPSARDFRAAATAYSGETLSAFLDKWTRFVDRVITRYQPTLLPVWPEFTDANAWGVANKDELARDYVSLLRATAAVARGRTTVAVGGFFLAPQPLWWPQLVAEGVLDCVDAVTVHPFTHYRDLSMVVAYQQQQLAEMASTLPVYITEMGLPCAETPAELHTTQPGNTEDGSGNVTSLCEAECARWWEVLLDAYEPYCQTVCAEVTLSPPSSHWGSIIGIGRWPQILRVFREHFPLAG